MANIHGLFRIGRDAELRQLCAARDEARQSALDRGFALLKLQKEARALEAENQRLRDALWVATEHNALHFGESHNTVIQGRAALTQEQGGSDDNQD